MLVILVTSVGRAPVRCARGRGFEPQIGLTLSDSVVLINFF